MSESIVCFDEKVLDNISSSLCISSPTDKQLLVSQVLMRYLNYDVHQVSKWKDLFPNQLCQDK